MPQLTIKGTGDSSSNNIALGDSSIPPLGTLIDSSSSSYNIALGTAALAELEKGMYNIVIGEGAMQGLNSDLGSSYNTVIGIGAAAS